MSLRALSGEIKGTSPKRLTYHTGKTGKCGAAPVVRCGAKRGGLYLVISRLGCERFRCDQWAGLGVGEVGVPLANAASAPGRKAVRSRSR